MKSTDRVWDDDGNVCSVEHFGSHEAAIAALKSCSRCENCINCERCIDCTDCINCKGCSHCDSCIDCTDCSDCEACNCLSDKDQSIGFNGKDVMAPTAKRIRCLDSRWITQIYHYVVDEGEPHGMFEEMVSLYRGIEYVRLAMDCSLPLTVYDTLMGCQGPIFEHIGMIIEFFGYTAEESETDLTLYRTDKVVRIFTYPN